MARRRFLVALVPPDTLSVQLRALRSLTGGRGRFTATHEHYDVLPAHLVDEIRREVEDAE